MRKPIQSAVYRSAICSGWGLEVTGGDRCSSGVPAVGRSAAAAVTDAAAAGNKGLPETWRIRWFSVPFSIRSHWCLQPRPQQRLCECPGWRSWAGTVCWSSHYEALPSAQSRSFWNREESKEKVESMRGHNWSFITAGNIVLGDQQCEENVLDSWLNWPWSRIRVLSVE